MAHIIGTAGNDTLTGTTGADQIEGLAGNDTLYGLAGNDTLNRGAGGNHMVGKVERLQSTDVPIDALHPITHG